MKIKNSELYDVQAGLQALDGQTIDGKLVRYKFSGTLLYGIAKNLKRVTEAIAGLEETRRKLRTQYGFDGDPSADDYKKPSSQQFSDLNNEWAALMNQESDIVLTQFKLSELRLPDEHYGDDAGKDQKVNNILPSTLAKIAPLIAEG